jgi:uncharacterized protein YqgV (UPF0045/DUF77 family)
MPLVDIGVDISLYPFEAHFAPVIHEFIERLSAHPGLKVLPGSLSTQVYGEYDQVFAAIREAVRATLEALQGAGTRAALVVKILGPL